MKETENIEDLKSFCDEFVVELQEGLKAKNFKQIHQASHLLRECLQQGVFHDAEVVTISKLIKEGELLLEVWKQSLGVGDRLEVYVAKEDKWFAAQIISGKVSESPEVVLHYVGWPDKYDTTMNLAEHPVNPPETFVFTGTKRKKSAADTPAPSQQSVTSVELPLELGRTRRQGAYTPSEPWVKRESKKRSLADITVRNSDWHCNMCNMLEASNESHLLICDGGCLRSFHQECLELDDHQVETWICSECQQGKHTCFACKVPGLDFVDVFKCSLGTCGKYYHLACITSDCAPYLPIKIDKARKTITLNPLQQTAYRQNYPEIKEDPVVLEVPTFKCSRHICDTCFAFHGPVAATDLNPCVYCPRAFHTTCVPPGSRFNSAVAVCPLHPEKPLPANNPPPADHQGKASNLTLQGKMAICWEQLGVPDAKPELAVSCVAGEYDYIFRLPNKVRLDVAAIPQDHISIHANIWSTYTGKTPPLITIDEGCECQDHCDERCLNRVVRVECSECMTLNKTKVCALGEDNCSNRDLQRKQYVQTQIFKEGEMGFGLKTLEPVRKGQLVIEYVGEIIGEEEMIARLAKQAVNTPHDKDFYIMELDVGIYVDGKHKGSDSRYINHSCDPNCELQKWNVKGKLRIAIVAIKNIPANEPLSYDYQFDTQEENVFKCYCGATRCRGTMAPRKRDRIVAAAISSADKDLRQKLILEGKAKSSKFQTIEARMEEEMTRSYTGKCLPGDAVNEFKHGPTRAFFDAAKAAKVFLVRNAMQSQYAATRKSQMEKRIVKTKAKRAAEAAAKAIRKQKW